MPLKQKEIGQFRHILQFNALKPARMYFLVSVFVSTHIHYLVTHFREVSLLRQLIHLYFCCLKYK